MKILFSRGNWQRKVKKLRLFTTRVLSTLIMMSTFFPHVSFTFPRTIIKCTSSAFNVLFYYVLFLCPRPIKHRIIRFTFRLIDKSKFDDVVEQRFTSCNDSLIRSNYVSMRKSFALISFPSPSLLFPRGAHNNLRHSSFRQVTRFHTQHWLFSVTRRVSFFCATCVIWTQNILMYFGFFTWFTHSHSYGFLIPLFFGFFQHSSCVLFISAQVFHVYECASVRSSAT